MSDAHHHFPQPAAVGGEGCDFDPVIVTAGAWRCRCTPGCSKGSAARCLQAQTLEVLCAGRGDADLATEFIGPLTTVVAGQKSAQGQALCQEFIAAMTSGDHAAALDACHRLVELGEVGEPQGWDEPSGRI